MKKKLFVMGMLVSFLTLSLVFVGCDDGKTDDDVEKTIVITGVTSTQESEGSSYIGIGVFTAGTSSSDITAFVSGGETSGYGYVAGADDSSGSATYSSGTLTTSLYSTPVGSSSRWKGTGTYDVYILLYNGSTVTVYQKTGVSINSATTTLAASTFTKVS